MGGGGGWSKVGCGAGKEEARRAVERGQKAKNCILGACD